MAVKRSTQKRKQTQLQQEGGRVELCCTKRGHEPFLALFLTAEYNERCFSAPPPPPFFFPLSLSLSFSFLFCFAFSLPTDSRLSGPVSSFPTYCCLLSVFSSLRTAQLFALSLTFPVFFIPFFFHTKMKNEKHCVLLL